MNPLERAQLSLTGLSVGDALGGFFEFASGKHISRVLATKALPSAPWRYTDDTNMALSVVAVLRKFGEIDQGALARSFGEHYDRGRGYGMAMHFLLPRYANGADWRPLAQGLFDGTGSFGNGSAMRVAPVGAYFADNINALIDNAQKSAEVTHAHPEAKAGAIAVALAAAFAYNTRDADAVTAQRLIDFVVAHTPASEVRAGLERARGLTLETPFDAVVTILGNGNRVAAMDTVPFAVWCAAVHLSDYEAAIWSAIRAGGDVDTICAMVGGIVACANTEIPDEWLRRREPLPNWV